jgi:hypothetical protein
VAKLHLLKGSGYATGILKSDEYIHLIEEFFQAESEQINNPLELSAGKEKAARLQAARN